MGDRRTDGVLAVVGLAYEFSPIYEPFVNRSLSDVYLSVNLQAG